MGGPMSLLALLLAMSTTAQTGITKSADGVPIHYETQGQGQPALVFVHGWAIDRSYWDAQVPVFAPATPPALVEAVVKDATSFPPEISVPVLEQSWRHDPRPLLRQIHVPIVAVNADRFPTRLDHARQYAPQYDALIVKGVGHYL